MLLDPGQPAVPGLVSTSEDHDRILRLETFLEVPAADEEPLGQLALQDACVGVHYLDDLLVTIVAGLLLHGRP